jgi:hypothetical protein
MITPCAHIQQNTPTLDSQLLRALVGRKADAQNRSHHAAILNDLLHAALDDIHRYGKAHTAVGA